MQFPNILERRAVTIDLQARTWPIPACFCSDQRFLNSRFVGISGNSNVSSIDQHYRDNLKI